MNRLIAVLILLAGAGLMNAQISLDLETGVAFSGYNDVRIPNEDTQTLFSFTKDLNSEPVMYGRANAHWLITPRHEVSLLISPLIIKPSGTLDYDVTYVNKVFEAGKEIDAVYKFNSYRLQYLYRFKNQNIGIRAIGLSFKVRDAIISLKNEDFYAEKIDLGFVPLIGFEFGYDINEELGVLLKGEALGSPFGRAEDVFAGITYKLADRYGVYMGLRVLEGGADVDEVYTFSNINYVTVGTQIRF